MHNEDMSDPVKILVVDDDEEIGIMLKMILEYNGFEVTVLQRADNTEVVASDLKVNLVILDMLIAGIKGTDVCKQLKADHNTKDIPVIMITALPEIEDLCKEAGADDFLAKPFDIDSLIRKVNKHVAKA